MGLEQLRTVCEPHQCNGCMACQDICHKNAVSVVDDPISFNAVIEESLCVHCGRCEAVCPNNHPQPCTEPIMWKQGWASDPSIRQNSSSGGVASALSRAFVQQGGLVCACVLETGEFCFKIAETAEQVEQFAGSKYVKSNPIGIYKQLKAAILREKKVLFIGLPCQVAAVKNYIGDTAYLYTVDLICHGTPSSKLLKMFLKENGLELKAIRDLRFRSKGTYRLADGHRSIKPPTVKDRYTHAFLSALCYTENCYSCQYASTARVSDVTLGDSWGSRLSPEEQRKGISLILCQSEKGQELLRMADLFLEEVDVENAIAHNRQLTAPSRKSAEHERFCVEWKRKQNFSRAVRRCYPRFCFRQNVKAILARIKNPGYKG